MSGPDFGGRRFQAVASDYDGTLAELGCVSETALDALRRFKAQKGALILVTGRVLPELVALFPELDVFDLVVAENGALLYWPKSRETRLLAPPPPKGFVEKLESLGVGPISVGHCIVATWEPHDAACLKAIREMELDLAIILNKNAVMILPSGVNKASGLEAALAALSLAPSDVIGFGDAENDLAFLKICGFSVAVQNALDSVKKAADWTTNAARGAGVAEVIDLYLAMEKTAEGESMRRSDRTLAGVAPPPAVPSPLAGEG
jgi:hydroxymethylpyrimidine pyrophosphatase-like HAD family hydrolase